MTKHKNGKTDLKAAGAARRAGGTEPSDWAAMENPAEMGGEMALTSGNTNLGVDTVQHAHLSDEEIEELRLADADEPEEDGHHYEQRESTERVEPLDKLAKNYLAVAVDSLRRVPATALSEQFRGRLLVYRHMIGRLTQNNRAQGESKIIAGVVTALAVDGAGKIDAIVFLRQVMGQILWSASMDITRLRKPARERDEVRDAPLGMQDMSDHSDAIAGIAGPDTNPLAVLDEVDVYSAVESLHGFLSAIADTLADTEDERLFLRLGAGLSYMDERIEDPNVAGGVRWEPVFDLDIALDLQLVKNQESLKKREAQRGARRASQLKKLAELYA